MVPKAIQTPRRVEPLATLVLTRDKGEDGSTGNRYCSTCGQHQSAEAAFCSSCGLPMTAATDSSVGLEDPAISTVSGSPPSRLRLVVAVAMATTIGVGAAAAYLTLHQVSATASAAAQTLPASSGSAVVRYDATTTLPSELDVCGLFDAKAIGRILNVELAAPRVFDGSGGAGCQADVLGETQGVVSMGVEPTTADVQGWRSDALSKRGMALNNVPSAGPWAAEATACQRPRGCDTFVLAGHLELFLSHWAQGQQGAQGTLDTRQALLTITQTHLTKADQEVPDPTNDTSTFCSLYDATCSAG